MDTTTSSGRTGARVATRILAAATLISAGAAIGDDGIAVRITNDSSADVLVTVIDMSVKPERTLISNETIYGFASISVQVSPDSSGYGHIRWTASSGSAGSRTCGHNETARLSAASSVHVSANNSCDMT